MHVRYAVEFGQTPPQLFTRPHPPRRLHLRRTVPCHGSHRARTRHCICARVLTATCALCVVQVPWRAVEPCATLIQACARRMRTRRRVEEIAISFYFDEAAFRDATVGVTDATVDAAAAVDAPQVDRLQVAPPSPLTVPLAHLTMSLAP